MPKRPAKATWDNRGGRVNNTEDKHYFGHDDRHVRRDGRYASRPRVSFKQQPRPSRNMRIAREIFVEAFKDDDSPMGVNSNNNNNNNRQVVVRGRGRGLSRGRNSPLPPRGFRGGILPRPPLSLGEANWYKIIVPYGQQYTKDYIINNLLSYIAPETFVPIMYKTMGSEAVFYVDDHKTANALLACDRKITTTDGFKLQVRVKPGFPHCEINDKLKEQLKQAMVKRYFQENNALDLSKFHQDPDLVADYFCALFRPVMLMTVLDIVAEYIPNLEALNLDGNKLNLIERLNVLHKKFPKLKILYIGDNKIREMHHLDVVKDLKLEELKLAGNPVCNKYKSRQSEYVSDVRRRFPKLLRLDGVDLPRPILFDVMDDASKIPPTQRIFTSNAKAQEIASQFLQQYFLVYDSGNRQPLLDAYNEHASFSLTVNTAYNANKLNSYVGENRNLFRVNDANRRQKLLKQGKLPVVSHISEMTKTKHFLNTFTMDISLVTERMMFVTVTGLFKELTKEEHVRYFNRTFIIVPQGTGYCICNEQLHISNTTETQRKLILNNTDKESEEPMAEEPMAEEPSISKTSNSAAEGTVPELSETVKQQMIVTLSQQTNMNLEWSLKCLREVEWNYENALSAFQEFFKRGLIPSEAFSK
ncbi:nuclear RNA export factor 1-like [Polistes fuscatus]|uniref:nuclear RNA export factor 1-like n=1 Tax=Polistes fuscatus TaxID=30207 RepID=UPI001CA9E5C9|nr:nuclear RNA export factor 1-like [Polistes fuscatus]